MVARVGLLCVTPCASYSIYLINYQTLNKPIMAKKRQMFKKISKASSVDWYEARVASLI